MPNFPLPLLAADAPSALEWLLAFFALASFTLLGLWTIARQRFHASIVEEARAEFSRSILMRFRLGMESRIGDERTVGSPASEGDDQTIGDEGESALFAYARIAEALSGGYAGIFYVDLRTGAFEPFRSDGSHVALQEYAGEDYFSPRVQEAILKPIHPDDVDVLRQAFRREALLAATKNGRIFTIPYRYVRSPGGEPVWFLARASRVSGGDDEHLVVAVSNIDEQMKREKGHEARADASVAKLEDLLERSARSRFTLVKLATYQNADELREVALRETGQSLGAVGVYLYQHRIDGTTPLVHHWALSPEHDVIPKDAAQIARTPDYLDEHPDIFYVLGQKEENNPTWDLLLRRVGATHFLAALLRVEGEVWGHVGYAVRREGGIDPEEVDQFREACALVQIAVLRSRIIDNRDTHQRELLASARAANQAAHAKTMFLATMSHEIRTPLNAVIGYSEFLNRPRLTPLEIQEYTSGISRSANALLSLINDILDLSKIEAGKIDMTGRCDLVKLFDEMEALFHYRAVTKNIRLSHTIRRDFPVLRLSEEHIRQVMLNLIGNAVKFTDSGMVEWTAEAHEDGDGTIAVDIFVNDTGIGVSKEKLKTIFEPFVQDGATRGGKIYSGTGLGLPIVKRLLEACNGTIKMESEPGEGTRTSIHIAGVRIFPKAAPLPAARSAAAGSGGEALKLPAEFRAVLVDDVLINLKILELHVKGLGVEDIVQATSGEEALRHIAEKRPDVVLTDMWMPGMSGADLAAAIRRDKSLDDVQLVAVTADNDVGATFDVSLFAEIVTKPVTADKLRLTMMRLFPKAR